MVGFSSHSDCYLNDFIIKRGIDGMKEKKIAEIQKLSGSQGTPSTIDSSETLKYIYWIASSENSLLSNTIYAWLLHVCIPSEHGEHRTFCQQFNLKREKKMNEISIREKCRKRFIQPNNRHNVT